MMRRTNSIKLKLFFRLNLVLKVTSENIHIYLMAMPLRSAEHTNLGLKLKAFYYRSCNKTKNVMSGTYIVISLNSCFMVNRYTFSNICMYFTLTHIFCYRCRILINIKTTFNLS